MASSGTYNFTLTNGEATLAALERVQIRHPEIRQEHMLTARREINLLFSEWSNRQVNLWEVTQLTVSLVQGTASYSIPSNVVMILDAYRSLNFGTATQIDSFMYPISRSIYATIADKFDQAPPTTFWFDRLINPTVTMWPVPDSGGPYTFVYYGVTQVQDANIPSGETPNIPYRWLDALVAGMAYRLARVYPHQDRPSLETDRKRDYDEAWGVAASQDTENVPFTITPSISTYYYRR